jgi:DNA-binding CsgD family transcriptional regulator
MDSNSTGKLHNRDSVACMSDEQARTVVDSLSAHIAILDDRGVIMDTNRAWRRFGEENGMPSGFDSRGDNYMDTCRGLPAADAEDAGVVADGIQAVIDGNTAEYRFDYPCHTPRREYWFYMRVIRVPGSNPVRVVVSHEDITELKQAEAALREKRKALSRQKRDLEEANIALKVLLKQRETDKAEIERRVLGNINELVMPYVEKLKRLRLKKRDRTTVDVIESHLNEIVSPLMQRLSNASIILTPQEMQVASLVKDGRSTKEISDILAVAETTIHFHRKNLRKKFGLRNKRQNLRSFLISISD